MLREKLKWRKLVDKLKQLDLRLKQKLLLIKPKENEELKSTVLKWTRKLKPGDLNRRESELRQSKDSKLKELNVRGESRNIDLNKRDSRQRDRLKLSNKESSMNKELKWKGWNAKRDLKSIESSKSASRRKEKFNLRP